MGKRASHSSPRATQETHSAAESSGEVRNVACGGKAEPSEMVFRHQSVPVAWARGGKFLVCVRFGVCMLLLLQLSPGVCWTCVLPVCKRSCIHRSQMFTVNSVG